MRKIVSVILLNLVLETMVAANMGGGKSLCIYNIRDRQNYLDNIHACPPLPSMLIKMDIFSPSNQVWLVRLLKLWQMTRSYIVQ